MTTPHKWADVIKAWADGDEIQFKVNSLFAWKDWDFCGSTPSFSSYEWRIKPKVVHYRRYLWKTSLGIIVGVLTDHPMHNRSADYECQTQFIRWIDTEWQEVEV